jgi:hypothetical protein
MPMIDTADNVAERYKVSRERRMLARRASAAPRWAGLRSTAIVPRHHQEARGWYTKAEPSR